MKGQQRNFNLRHPERIIGEVFIGNLDDGTYAKLPYATKRQGKKAYTKAGSLVPSVRPAFVERTELEQHPDAKELVWTLYQHDLWMIRYNRNHTHPELKTGEIFLGNESPESFAEITWATKRLGETAFGPDGIRVPDAYPMFVQRAELLGSPDGRNILRALLREGIA